VAAFWLTLYHVAAEFRILGDVEARSQWRRLDIGHARQRCVLACLLIDVNRATSADQLVDRVWADDPPHRARNALAAYVSRLRQLLAAEDVPIVHGPGGYTLTVDALSVDLHLFREMASRARAATDPVEAAGHFERALGLWRGAPLATLDTPWANDVRTSLEAERLSVVLDRNDAALATGGHAELLGELVATAQEHPLDERVAGQLMLAQYFSGRQADALETYRRVRNRLVDELGVDPGPKLRHVHEQILAGDQEQPIRMTPPPVRQATTHIPRRATSLIGRERQVGAIADTLSEASLITLTGVGGVGKTRLALEVAERSHERFDDGAVFCELAPVDNGAALGHAVAASLRLQEQPGLGIEATVEYLRGHELLLVLDNCEHILDAAAQLVERIVRECPNVTVLATSREVLGVDGEQIVAVPPLHEADAARLFAERARASRPDFDLEREPVGAVAEICRRLDGVPLAIELAAARMRAMSSLEVARRLDRLRLLSGGARGAHPRQQSVVATIDWSYRLLAEPEQALFERLSVFAGGFDLEAVHGVCGEEGANEDDTLELLAGLVDKSMVIVRGGTGATRYDVLETLRAYGRDRLREKKIEDQIAERHAVYFTDLLERAAVGMRGPDEQIWTERLIPQAETTFTLPDYDNLRTAFERAIAVSDIDLALRLVTSLNETVHMRVGVPSAGWVDRVVELADPDHPLFVGAAGVAARIEWSLGEFSRARSLVGLAKGRVPGPGASYTLYPADVLADVSLYEGDVAAALAYYQAELERTQDPLRLVWITNAITLCHVWLRTSEAGLPAAHEAVRVADATANPTARSLARCALGRALADSDPDGALTELDHAAELAMSVRNGWLVALAWTESAAIHAVHGDPAATARKFVELLDHLDRGGQGCGPNQWRFLRDATRLLVRVGADADALALHRALDSAGLASPLDATELARLGAADETALTGLAAVALARSSLQRYC